MSLGLEHGEGLDRGPGGDEVVGEGGDAPFERGHGVVGPQPVAVTGDPDGEGVVAVVVDGPQHVGGGRAAHLVFGGSAPEQHDEADAVRKRHGRRV